MIAERWIEPVICAESLAGRVGEQPVLDRLPLGQAANNCYAAFALASIVRADPGWDFPLHPQVICASLPFV